MRIAKNREFLTWLIRILLCVPVTFGLVTTSRAAVIGPDAAGYLADDSAAFDFQDISTSGTNLGAGDQTTHGPIALGFLFRYYGYNFTEADISSNGWISFDDPGVPGGSDATNNCPLPDPDGQDNLIAAI